jgi:hypothetical protein
MKIKIIKDYNELDLYAGSVLHDSIELETGYYEGVHSSMYGSFTLAVPKEYCEIINEPTVIKCYCGEQDMCDCDPPPPKPKQYTDKEKVNFFTDMLINLHTYRWTGDGEKVKRVLDAIGGFSYAHTNSNFYDEDDKLDRAYERMVKTMDEIVQSPASWRQPKKVLDDSITKDTLEIDGWKYIEKSPFTGKPTWVKKEESIGLEYGGGTWYKYEMQFNEYQNSHQITYLGGEFSRVMRTVETMQQVKDFVKVLG